MNSQEKPKGSILALLVRIYVVIGTSLYYLLFKMEQLIARLGNNSKLPILDTFTAEKWQVKSVRLTLAFPVAFPVIFLRNLLLLVCALIWTILRYIAHFLQMVALRTARASKPIADRTASTVQTIWEETAQSADESLPISLPDIQDVRETMTETGDRVRERLGAVGESLGSAASTVGERASDVVDVARERFSEAIAKDSTADAITSGNGMPPTGESEAGSSAARVAINTATLGQLTTLPGIGEALAQRILDYREAQGPFEDMNALTAVSGLGSGLLEKLEGLIVFD